MVRLMDALMDRMNSWWMADQTNGWMDGWMDDGHTDSCMSEWMDWLDDGRLRCSATFMEISYLLLDNCYVAYRCLLQCWEVAGSFFGTVPQTTLMIGPFGWMHVFMDTWMEGRLTVKWIHGWMDGWINRRLFDTWTDRWSETASAILSGHHELLTHEQSWNLTVFIRMLGCLSFISETPTLRNHYEIWHYPPPRCQKNNPKLILQPVVLSLRMKSKELRVHFCKTLQWCNKTWFNGCFFKGRASTSLIHVDEWWTAVCCCGDQISWGENPRTSPSQGLSEMG